MCHIKREYMLAHAPVVQVHFRLTFSQTEKTSNSDEMNVVLSPPIYRRSQVLKFQKLWEQTLSVIHITLGEIRSRSKESYGVGGFLGLRSGSTIITIYRS